MLFDPNIGFLRYVRLGDHEIVRAIYGAVRDNNWNTIRPRFEEVKIGANEDSFRISFTARSEKDPVGFDWEGTIIGEADRVTYSFEGEAKITFLKNRIGLCVLHPLLECAGQTCTIEHWDGTMEHGTFPKEISPTEPFKNIRAIRYAVASGVTAEVRFEGEVFEMEDQRNWTDGSFKTYSTPADLPRPVEIKQGTRVSHRVTISLVGSPRKILPVVQGRPAQISVLTTPLLPKAALGFSLGAEPKPLSSNQLKWLDALHPAHLRVDIDFRESFWPSKFAEAAEISARIRSPLHVAILLAGEYEARLDELLALVAQLDPHIMLWLLFHESENSLSPATARIAQPKLANFNPNILIASGSRENFADLNRNRPAPGSGTLPVYSISPQIHSIDEMSMIENLEGEPPTVQTSCQFSKQIVVVSPITLLPSEFAFASKNAPADPRQKSLFAAAWTVGSLSKMLPSPQLHSLTYFSVSGAHGIMDSEVYPLWHVFRGLAEFGRVFPTQSTHPLQVAGVTLVNDREHRRLLVANLLSETQQVKLKTGSAKARIQYLGESNLARALREPEQFAAESGELVEPVTGKVELNLGGYAIARVDLE